MWATALRLLTLLLLIVSGLAGIISRAVLVEHPTFNPPRDFTPETRFAILSKLDMDVDKLGTITSFVAEPLSLLDWEWFALAFFPLLLDGRRKA